MGDQVKAPKCVTLSSQYVNVKELRLRSQEPGAKQPTSPERGGRWGGQNGGHLRDVGWVSEPDQVAEERGSITEHQIQGHQPDDTWREKRGWVSGQTF